MNENINTTVTDGENITTTGEAGDTTPKEGGKTFTQEQVNNIVRDRLSKERDKLSTDLVQRERELTEREFVYKARDILTERKLPLELLDALNAPDLETLEKSLSLLEAHTNILNPNQVLDLPPVGQRAPIDRDHMTRVAMGLTKHEKE